MRRLVLMALTILALGSPAMAQTYPNHPVRLIVPFGPGGAPDVIARLIAQQLTVQTGQSFFVENRPGANGITGTDAVAKAAPDGHTLLVVSASFVVNPSIYRKLPFDPIKDFAPITNICSLDAFILTVTPSLPARTLAEFVALARKPDSNLSYGSPGTGNTLQLAAALLNARIGASMVHVPYRSGADAVTALLAGQIQVMFTNSTLALAHIEAGKLRALAYTGRTRAPDLPEVPTMAEAGLDGMEIDGGWFGAFAPAGTPPEIVARLEQEIAAALKMPALRERLNTLALHPVGNPSAAFKPFVAREVKSYAEMVRAAGIVPE
jgi:tripartite-type tricarboxylate transporter receptor subunit TctC